MKYSLRKAEIALRRTIREKMDGIVSFRPFRYICNAKMEGFNNKIRWFIKQVCGFWNREYIKLKIFQLPKISSVKDVCFLSETVEEAFFILAHHVMLTTSYLLKAMLFDKKEQDMDVLTIMDEMQRMEKEYSHNQIAKVLYIADTGENTCHACLDNDGKIFDIDDPCLPQLPIHPHCRCRYVSVAAPHEDVSEAVERYHIVKNLNFAANLDEEKAKSLAEQIINARRGNSKLREQRLFLLFNGRYLISSDGKLLLDAVSGRPVSERTTVNLTTMFGGNETVEREFDYSYSRQGIRNKGGIPWGLYHIESKEERSAKTSPLSHIIKSRGWGNYAWTLHPDKDTDIRKRSGFFIHGGSDFGSAGCIDLQEGDTKFQEYFVSTKLSSMYVYVKYEKVRVTIREKKPEVYFNFPPYMP